MVRGQPSRGELAIAGGRLTTAERVAIAGLRVRRGWIMGRAGTRMSFLAPLFLVGALAVGFPIVFHLIRRTSREKLPFSSLMFLKPTPPRLTRRSRLEHLLLLALRCLVLALLAAGFARPFLKTPLPAASTPAAAARTVLLVDTSASMRRDGLWTEARSRAESILRRTPAQDRLTLLAFDQDPRPLVTFDEWTALAPGDRAAMAAGQLAEASPGWSGTHLGRALLHAVELLEAEGRAEEAAGSTGPRRIVIVSDLQDGAALDGLQGFDWPKGIEVTLEPLRARRPTNAGLHLAPEADGTGAATNAGFKVRVSNAADSRREQFQAGWVRAGAKGFAAPPVDVYVPPGQSRVAMVPALPPGLPAEQLALSGDDEEFDNPVYAAPNQAEQITVRYLGSDSDKDPQQLAYFLKRALQQTRQRSVTLSVHSPETAVPQPPAGGARLMILGEAPGAAALEAARAWLASGRTLLFPLRSAADAATLAGLLGAGTVSAEEARGGNYALLGQIDFTHPLFAPFSDPRYSDFTKIHFWKHRRLDAGQLPGATVLARFDNGDPAVLHLAAGRGSLFVLTSSWLPSDSQLALSSKFVPLLYSLLEMSGGPGAAPSQFLVGNRVPLAGTNAAGGVTLRLPEGGLTNLPANATSFVPRQPGHYAAWSGAVTQRFAVNLDPAESRTAPMPPDQLERLGVPLQTRVTPATPAAQAKNQERLQAAELEQRQKLWRWILIAALVALVTETFVAGWLARRSAAAAAAG